MHNAKSAASDRFDKHDVVLGPQTPDDGAANSSQDVEHLSLSLMRGKTADKYVHVGSWPQRLPEILLACASRFEVTYQM
jgi:hypothetical protein